MKQQQGLHDMVTNFAHLTPVKNRGIIQCSYVITEDEDSSEKDGEDEGTEEEGTEEEGEGTEGTEDEAAEGTEDAKVEEDAGEDTASQEGSQDGVSRNHLGNHNERLERSNDNKQRVSGNLIQCYYINLLYNLQSRYRHF